mgnify:CR=1 FL=1
MPTIHYNYIRSGDIWYRVERAGGAFVGATDSAPLPAPEPFPAPSEDGIRRLSIAVPEPGEYFVILYADAEGVRPTDLFPVVCPPLPASGYGIGAAVGSA